MVVESGGRGRVAREKATPEDLGILNKRGAKGSALNGGKGAFLMTKKIEV